jgi:hypothetical protein
MIISLPWLVFLIMQDNMLTTHPCTLLGGFSRDLHSVDYSWGISTKPPQAYNTESRGLQPLIWYTKFRRLHREFGTLHLGGSHHGFGCTEFSEVTMAVSQEGNLKSALAATMP